MIESYENGAEKEIDGVPRVYYDGYWIKKYDPPADSWVQKKRLIDALTRRLFNHMEHGINIPGSRLDEARAAYDAETDPKRKRVKGAMLAGALFNRAADIFTHLVELEACGVRIKSSNDLMRECGRCLTEALEFGKTVKHRSGDEGIDELWGEPFKAFTMPIEAFYQSRYIKIAMTMRDIDRLAGGMIEGISPHSMFSGIEPLVSSLVCAARKKCETLRTDADIFEVWAAFVVACENLIEFSPTLGDNATQKETELAEKGLRLVAKGVGLICDVTRARTPMPKSTEEYLERCEKFRLIAQARGDANTPKDVTAVAASGTRSG